MRCNSENLILCSGRQITVAVAMGYPPVEQFEQRLLVFVRKGLNFEPIAGIAPSIRVMVIKRMDSLTEINSMSTRATASLSVIGTGRGGVREGENGTEGK